MLSISISDYGEGVIHSVEILLSVLSKELYTGRLSNLSLFWLSYFILLILVKMSSSSLKLLKSFVLKHNYLKFLELTPIWVLKHASLYCWSYVNLYLMVGNEVRSIEK